MPATIINLKKIWHNFNLSPNRPRGVFGFAAVFARC